MYFVAVGEDLDAVTAFARDLPVTVPVLLDDDGAAVLAILPKEHLARLPEGQLPVAINVLVDAAGRIRYLDLRGEPGFDPTLTTVEHLIAALLGVTPPLRLR